MRRVLLPAILVLGLLVTLIVGGPVTATGDPFIGTWHQRDVGTSNIFYFIDEPVGGVFPVLYFDDFTALEVCGDHGPMLWAGFGQKTDATHLEGSFGTYWCLEGSGIAENPLPLPERNGWTLTYDPDTDTISDGIGQCIGTRQQIEDVAEAQKEVAQGDFPPPDPGPPFVCEEDR